MTGTPTMIVASAQIERDMIADVRLKAMGETAIPSDILTWTKFEIGRDYEGDFELLEGLVYTDFSSGNPQALSDRVNHLTIGRTLKAGSSIVVPAYNAGTGRTGLQSQVVINRDNHPGLHWLGSVTVGTDTLDQSTTVESLHGQYIDQPDGLGGGSIGVVPFRMNGTSTGTELRFRQQTSGMSEDPPVFSFPEPSSPDTFTTRENEIDGVAWRPFLGGFPELFAFDVEFYGLVSVFAEQKEDVSAYAKATPFRLFRRIAGSTSESDWKDYTPCAEPSYSIEGRVANFQNFPTGQSPESAPTRPFLFQNGYEYKLEPDRREIVDLGCDGGEDDNVLLRCVTGIEPRPLVAPDRIIFRVGTDCTADLNGDGLVNGADLSALLGAFGNEGECPEDLRVPYRCQCENCPVPCDINGDDIINGADLSVMLFRFNSTCASMEPTGMGFNASMSTPASGPTGAQILAYLNFETFESYSTWLNGLSEQQLTAHIADLLSIIAELEQSEH